MKRLLWIVGLLSTQLHAANFPISAGAPTSTIQSTINTAAAASGGNTVTFAAGNYSITSPITIPCPASALTIQGPTPAGLGTTWPITPTAILTNNGITNNWGFLGTACNVGTTVQYLQWNGNHPAGGGGGFLKAPAGMNNLTVTYNWFYGNYAIQTTQQSADAFIWIDGNYTGARTQNTTISWNRFGFTGSGDLGGPTGLMTLYGGGGGAGICTAGYRPPTGTGTCLYQGQPNLNSGGGSGAAFGLHNNTDNFTFVHNQIQEQEQGGKCFQNNGGTVTSTNTLIQFNDFSGVHRIGYETQCNDGLINFDSNVYHDPYFISANSWAFSLPNGNTNSTNNVLISNVPIQNDRNGNTASWAGDGIEFWGGLTSSNNLIQGLFAEGIHWGFQPGGASINNNIIQLSAPGATFIACCDQGASNPPTQSGNVTSTTVSARASVAPTISPSSGTAPLTVTLTDPGYTSGAGPQGNTGIWYTTDGSTPVPGAAKYLISGGTFSLPSAATVKAVGMWGALNQPTSYASGYGFVPSAVVSAAFTASGLFISPTGNDANPGTSASPWLTPNHAMTCGQTITALPGTYNATNFQNGDWGTVTCPAANNVAWLTCQTFDTCKISSTTTSAMHLDKSFWGVQGWEVTTSTNTSASGFQIEPAASTVIHHIIIANNVVNGAINGGITAYNNGTAGGSDYLAFLGNVVYNAASTSAVCASGINIYEPIASDTNAGTHMYVAGNFSYHNRNPNPCAGGTPTDGEGFIFDTWDGHQQGTPVYSQQGVIYNNISLDNGGRGIQPEYNNVGSPNNATIFVEYNTTYGNEQDVSQTIGGEGECMLYQARLVTFTHNLCATSGATDPAGTPVFAASIQSGDATDVVTGNWLAGQGGNNTATSGSGAFAFGPNTLGTSPSFTSTTIPGAPACAGTANVPACMATMINNFKPTASGSGSFGYQAPSNTSITDPLYPAWLCNVSLPSGLVTPGCGGTSPTAATPVLSPATGSFFVSTSVSVSDTTPSSTIFCTTNGTTPTTGSPVYSGPFTVTSTTTIQCIAAASGFLNSAVGSGTYTLAIPPLTQCNQGNTGSVNSMAIGGTTQQFAQCVYAASGETLLCSPAADKYGDVATVWGTAGAAITVGAIGNPPGCGGGLNGPGCVTGISATAGTPVNSTLTVGTHPCSPWGWNITNSPPTLLSATVTLQGGGAAVNVGSTVQVCANMFYTGSISTQLCNSGTDPYGTVVSTFTSSAPSKATISSTTGMLLGVAAGTTNAGVTAGAFTPSLAVSVNTPITGVSAAFSGAQLSGAQIQ